METFDLRDELFSMFGDGVMDHSMIKLEPQDLEVESEADYYDSCTGVDFSPRKQKSEADEEDEKLIAANPDDVWSEILNNVVLHDDPMMSETSQPVDHCYSSTAATSKHPSTTNTYISRNSTIRSGSMNPSSSNSSSLLSIQTVKQTTEPKIITVRSGNSVLIETKTGRPAQSLLKQNLPTVSSTSTLLRASTTRPTHRVIYPVNRLRPGTMTRSPSSEDEDVCIDSLPLTPPSSSQSSDSEGGGVSPQQSPPSSPVRQVLVARATGTGSYRYNPATAIYSQPIPTSGVLRLTEEEKRTFISEGYPLPTRLPLSKIEERNLKKVRRKIKNKISAQESRRKKKEYMDQLEKKVDDIVKENDDLKRRAETYETSNRSLVSQLNKLQQLVKRISPKHVTAQTTTCLMVMVLCFAVFFGEWLPLSSYSLSSSTPASHMSGGGLRGENSYITSNMRTSRTLSSMADVSSEYEEPWPVKLAKYSVQWTARLINSSTDNNMSTEATTIIAEALVNPTN